MMKIDLYQDAAIIPARVIRRTGVSVAILAPLTHGRDVCVGFTRTEYAQLLSQSVRMFETLKAVQVEMPPCAFRAKSQAALDVIQEIARVVNQVKFDDDSLTDIPPLTSGEDPWQYDPDAPLTPGLIELGFDAEVVAAREDGEMYTVAVTTKSYAHAMTNARRMLAALERARSVLPIATDAIDAVIDKARATTLADTQPANSLTV